MPDIEKIKYTDVDGHTTDYDIADAQARVDVAGKVDRAGDTMTGNLKVPSLLVGDTPQQVRIGVASGHTGIGSGTDIYVSASDDSHAVFLVGGEVDVVDTIGNPIKIRKVADPVQNTDAANKQYVDDTAQAESAAAASGKVDTVDNTITDAVAYIALGESGGNSTRRISTEVVSNTIAQRESGGRLKVGEPTTTSHAATKNYVDTHIAATVGAWENITITPNANYHITAALRQRIAFGNDNVYHYIIAGYSASGVVDDYVCTATALGITPSAIVGYVSGTGTVQILDTNYLPAYLNGVIVNATGVNAKDVSSYINNSFVLDFVVKGSE